MSLPVRAAFRVPPALDPAALDPQLPSADVHVVAVRARTAVSVVA